MQKFTGKRWKIASGCLIALSRIRELINYFVISVFSNVEFPVFFSDAIATILRIIPVNRATNSDSTHFNG
jgi:hypothetical protein